MSSKICVDLENIDLIVNKLTSLINAKDMIILLRGDLASGTTTLVKSYVKHLGYKDNVTSPTFSIQSQYGTNIYHYESNSSTLITSS